MTIQIDERLLQVTICNEFKHYTKLVKGFLNPLELRRIVLKLRTDYYKNTSNVIALMDERYYVQ